MPRIPVGAFVAEGVEGLDHPPRRSNGNKRCNKGSREVKMSWYIIASIYREVPATALSELHEWIVNAVKPRAKLWRGCVTRRT